MGEDVLPFFIKDLQESLPHKVQSTPMKTSFFEPSIIICSESSSVKKDGLKYSIYADKEGQNYTPDINRFFNSFAMYSDNFDISVLIMTGIGNDGVDGAKTLKEKGAIIYAQDEESSPVYGMPKAAFESGIVDRVKSLDEIRECFGHL